jgi:hypothetical protein
MSITLRLNRTLQADTGYEFKNDGNQKSTSPIKEKGVRRKAGWNLRRKRHSISGNIRFIRQRGNKKVKATLTWR